MVDITFSSVMGDVFPWVLPAAGCLLNCALERIKNSNIHVLNQLTVHHHVFKNSTRLIVIAIMYQWHRYNCR
jgi:hypothetical protein